MEAFDWSAVAVMLGFFAVFFFLSITGILPHLKDADLYRRKLAFERKFRRSPSWAIFEMGESTPVSDFDYTGIPVTEAGAPVRVLIVAAVGCAKCDMLLGQIMVLRARLARWFSISLMLAPVDESEAIVVRQALMAIGYWRGAEAFREAYAWAVAHLKELPDRQDLHPLLREKFQLSGEKYDSCFERARLNLERMGELMKAHNRDGKYPWVCIGDHVLSPGTHLVLLDSFLPLFEGNPELAKILFGRYQGTFDGPAMGLPGTPLKEEQPLRS
jgi:hypothetical protein